MNLEFSNSDIEAINRGDSNFLLDKGAKYYIEENYEKAIEYYRLSASLGNIQAISNLGYCYLYGRSIEKNTDLALAYFKIAANKGNIDALYKLGNMYSYDKYVEKDEELSIYYYTMALEELEKCDYIQRLRYPSIHLAIAKELIPGGSMRPSIETAYKYLKMAEKGFEMEINEDNNVYKESLENTRDLLKNNIFDEIRAEIDEEFEYIF